VAVHRTFAGMPGVRQLAAVMPAAKAGSPNHPAPRTLQLSCSCLRAKAGLLEIALQTRRCVVTLSVAHGVDAMA
jgi:hypothetical protein